MENKEPDRFLPIANISRIMKKALPENGKIAKDAKETVQECVSEFISFITSEACEKCKNEKRKTINGEDLLHAMNTLGFDNYLDILKLYLQKYREVTKNSEKIEKIVPSQKNENNNNKKKGNQELKDSPKMEPNNNESDEQNSNFDNEEDDEEEDDKLE